jgi:hypothetical protein
MVAKDWYDKALAEILPRARRARVDFMFEKRDEASIQISGNQYKVWLEVLLVAFLPRPSFLGSIYMSRVNYTGDGWN